MIINTLLLNRSINLSPEMKIQKHTLGKYLFDMINPLLLLLSLSHWLGVGSTNYCIVAIAYPPPQKLIGSGIVSVEDLEHCSIAE